MSNVSCQWRVHAPATKNDYSPDDVHLCQEMAMSFHWEFNLSPWVCDTTQETVFEIFHIVFSGHFIVCSPSSDRKNTSRKLIMCQPLLECAFWIQNLASYFAFKETKSEIIFDLWVKLRWNPIMWPWKVNYSDKIMDLNHVALASLNTNENFQ